MRQTTEDWLKGKTNPFNFTGSDNSLSGIVNSFHSMLIVPISNRARLDMMTKHGQPYNAERNENLMDQVAANPTTMYVENLRDTLNELDEDELFLYRGKKYFDPKLLKVFIKPYTRKMDELTIWFNESIMHIVCPEGDWGCFIAHCETDEEIDAAWEAAKAKKFKPKPKTFNPMTGEWE